MFTLRVMSDSQRILDSIRRLVRMLRVSDRQAQAELGVSGAQLFVLTELGKTPALSLNELAARTLTDQSSVSVVVTRLVDAGLVTRDRDDARCAAARPQSDPFRPRAAAESAAGRRRSGCWRSSIVCPTTSASDSPTRSKRSSSSVGADEGPAPMLFEDDASAPAARLKAVPKEDAAAK